MGTDSAERKPAADLRHVFLLQLQPLDLLVVVPDLPAGSARVQFQGDGILAYGSVDRCHYWRHGGRLVIGSSGSTRKEFKVCATRGGDKRVGFGDVVLYSHGVDIVSVVVW